MSRTAAFHNLSQAMYVAAYCDQSGVNTAEGLARVEEMATGKPKPVKRREFIHGLGTTAAVGVTLRQPRHSYAGKPTPNVNIGIVGAGLAGLTCAYTLQKRGRIATLYEGRGRIGGRQWSMGGAFNGAVNFPDQVVELGGEFIDNLHKTLLGYAQEFGLIREDVGKNWLDGETAWRFNGQRVPEATIVNEFRDLVSAMRHDLTRLSRVVTVNNHSAFDRDLDFTNLREYLEAKGAAPNILAAINVSYTGEYGLEIEQQSALNLLLSIHADKRAKFKLFGVFTDERWHIEGGNQQISENLAYRLSDQIRLGMKLLAIQKTTDGRVELTFDQNGTTITGKHDAVVLAIPFSILRDVEFFGLDLPDSKLMAINEMLYGTNAKLHVGFNKRIWGEHSSNGVSYSDLPNHQTTWESNPSRATERNAVAVYFSGGNRGAALRPGKLELETEQFLMDFDKLYPGALDAAVRRDSGSNKFLSHLQHWPSDPFIKGSYVCSHPGYFTTIAGNEATPVDNLYFAGSHTDSFYEWQGFQEGAANSGIRAAKEILRDFR